MSSRAVAYLHQPRFRRPHGQLRSAPPSRRRRRCRHPPSRMKSWAVAGPYTRAAAQPAFSYDFSQVRIHTDSRAAQSAETIGASACTVGNHIAFDAGRHRPGAPQWVHLVAHELTHVVQARPRPSCGAGRGRSRRRQRTRDRLRRIVAGPGPGAGRKSRLVAGLAAVLPLAGWSSRVGGLWPAAHAGGRGQGAGRLPARHALHQALRCPEGGRRDRCHAGTGGGRRHRPATTARRALARS